MISEPKTKLFPLKESSAYLRFLIIAIFFHADTYFCPKSEVVEKTLKQFDKIFGQCKEVFLKKMQDYGSAWRVLRPSSLTDQLLIKARRIRSIQENRIQKVEDSIEGDFTGIINYAIMALIQLEMPPTEVMDIKLEEAEKHYDKQCKLAISLLKNKNYDYSEVWREMRLSSITDLILMKLLRIRQIEDNEGRTIISEGLDANYLDIINYAVFARILMEEAPISKN